MTQTNTFTVALALGTMLMLAMAGTATAASQSWNLLADNTAGPLAGSPTPGEVVNGASALWTAPAALVDVDFGSASWGYSLQLTNAGCGSFKLHVGKVDGTGFQSFGSATLINPTDATVMTGSIVPSADVLIPQGASLAFQLENTAGDTFGGPGGCNTGQAKVKYMANSADTFFSSPNSDPGYPTPELATLLLVAVGGVGIVAVAMRRRK